MFDTLRHEESFSKILAEGEEKDEESVLVFRDLNGTIWQISRVDDVENFDELIDDAEPELNFFKPLDEPIEETL